jgi:hypothetical protein
MCGRSIGVFAGMFGDYEVISGCTSHLCDAVSVSNAVLLALPRTVFELAVKPKVTDPFIKRVSRDVTRQSHMRFDWWAQRLSMQLPRNVTPAMQIGAVPCGRCGSLQHVTNSTACQLHEKVTSNYTIDGRLKKLDTNKPVVNGKLPCVDSKGTLESCGTPVQVKPPVTDITPYRHLAETLKLCKQKWYSVYACAARIPRNNCVCCRVECDLLDPTERHEVLTTFSLTENTSPAAGCDEDWTETDSACASSVTLSAATLPQLEKHLDSLIASASVRSCLLMR